MKLFKRNPWITIWKEYGYATMVTFGREHELAAKTVVQVKKKRDGSYKTRAFVARAADSQHITDMSLDYLLHQTDGDEKLVAALKDYNITV